MVLITTISCVVSPSYFDLIYKGAVVTVFLSLIKTVSFNQIYAILDLCMCSHCRYSV